MKTELSGNLPRRTPSRSRGAAAGRARPQRPAQVDLEALGLPLLALGVLILGLLVPLLPTGELGAMTRNLAVGRAGVGAYLLPWPLLFFGGALLLQRPIRRWWRLLLGYLIVGAGAWLLVTLLQPPLGGAWGVALHGAAAGAAGVLAYLLALVVILVGADLLLGKAPMTLLRGGVKRGVGGVQRALQRGARLRRRLRERAALNADVALARGRLKELASDLSALERLYPGSAELARWKGEVARARGSLKGADAATLEDTRADLDAWEEAIGGFTAGRVEELRAQLLDEGVLGFEDRHEQLAQALGEGFRGSSQLARALEDTRRTLLLDLTALAERYGRTLRERDLAAQALADRGTTARELVRASEGHHARAQKLAGLEQAQAALACDAERLGAWRGLLERLEALARDLSGDASVAAFDNAVAGRLRKNRAELAEREAHEAALGELEAALEVVGGAPPAESAERGDNSASGDTGASGDTDAAADETWAPPPVRVSAAPPWADEAEAERGTLRDDTGPAWDDVGDEDLEPAASDEEGAADPLPEVGGIPIQLPALELLDAPIHAHEDPAAQQREVRARIAKIDETLANFRLQGRVVASVRGPTVTRFEVEPAPGEKISRFSNLSDDLALAMAVGSVRIEAPIPGKSVIGLEVPNAHRDLIKFREAAEAPPFRRARARLPLILGKSIDGEMLVGDLSRMPHLLIAGSTGSGKSVAVNTLVGSLLYKFLPTELRFLMIDPKMVELTPFDGIPHLLRPVVTNPNDAAGVLLGAVAHMERRYKMMSKLGAKNLDQYNQKARNLDLPELPFIVIIIDELADLMITSPKEVESAIMRLAQMARATGMHLILATQRPSVDILTSLIKVNVPARIAFAVSSGHDSRTILDTMGAERLTGMGDMLFYQPGLAKPVRLQGPFISEDEIFTLASFLRRQIFDDDFVEAYGADFDPPPSDESTASGLVDWNDDKLREAAELVVSEGQASVSRLQRRLSVGHARAGKLMDSLEALGVVGAHVGSKPREVLVELHELPDIFGK
ncbi:cell division protein FtsK/SpoIIIE [Truepera radiovictrix DSM 17093]|uniref:Cell division protein FtsK/SpoIIIE n=2 Tax=Truepera TaxID=332248 RepID=D7CVR1_TRURR|nr:cell division protein FtsK/SpoIIIE [Truepera radiovictrix DSM 17093]